MSEISETYQEITPELFFEDDLSMEMKQEAAKAVTTQDDLWILAQLLMES